jgi:hypothetical protein
MVSTISSVAHLGAAAHVARAAPGSCFLAAGDDDAGIAVAIA